MDAVGQASIARAAWIRSSRLPGCRTTIAWPSTSPNIHGAHCRETSQLMQVVSTNQGPVTLAACRRDGWAMGRLSRQPERRRLHDQGLVARVVAGGDQLPSLLPAPEVPGEVGPVAGTRAAELGRARLDRGPGLLGSLGPGGGPRQQQRDDAERLDAHRSSETTTSSGSL